MSEFFDRDSSGEFCDFEFVRCFFRNCALSITRNPWLRSTIRNVKLVQCEQQAGTLHAAILRDVVVDGLKTNGLLQTWATVFDRVTLKGRVDDLMMSNAVAGGLAAWEAKRTSRIDLTQTPRRRGTRGAEQCLRRKFKFGTKIHGWKELKGG